MKHFIVIFFLFISLLTVGQSPSDSITIGAKKYKAPKSCRIMPNSKIECPTYTMTWYLKPDWMILENSEGFIDHLGVGKVDFKKEKINLYFLDNEAKGYKISFKSGNKIIYQLVAFGAINGEVLIFQLTVKKDIKSNNDISDFPRQIIRLNS